MSIILARHDKHLKIHYQLSNSLQNLQPLRFIYPLHQTTIHAGRVRQRP